MARTIAKDHEEKRQAILRKAAEFFSENGFDRSSMNQLAGACGVSKALIYHYYDSKDALLFDIVFTHLSELLAAVREAAGQSDDPEADLRRILHTILLAYRDADAQHQVQNDAMSSLPEAERAALVDIQRQLVAIVGEALRAVAPETFDDSPEKLRPATMALFGMVNWFYMWHRPGKGLSREEYADLVTDLILRGVCGLGGGRG